MTYNLDPRAYPSLQFVLETIIQYYKSELLELPQSATQIPSTFPQLAIILERLLSDDNLFDSYKSTALEKLTVMDLLRLPVNFVYIVLGKCFPSVLINNLPHQQVVNIYSEFIKFISNNAKYYPCLKEAHTQIQKSKKSLHEIQKSIKKSNIFNEIYIHRLKLSTDIALQKSIMSKKIVVDYKDEHCFPSDTHYHVKSKSLYIIQPSGKNPQLHILVMENNSSPPPPSDDDIKNLFKMQYDIDRLCLQFGSWYIGVVVYNLFEGNIHGKLERSLFSLRDMIKRNIACRKKVHRSKKNRPADGTIYGAGSVKVQGHGVNREWKTLPLTMKESQRFRLYDQSDKAVDIFLKILEALFPSMVHTWRLQTLHACAAPTGNLGVAITSFFTRCYAAGIHVDVGDLSSTLALRVFRPKEEHKWAHHFFYPFLCSISSDDCDIGVMIKQETGTIWSFEASRFAHGTTIAVDGVRPDDSIGIVLVQKKGLFTFTKNSNLENYINFRGQEHYYDGNSSDEDIGIN